MIIFRLFQIPVFRCQKYLILIISWWAGPVVGTSNGWLVDIHLFPDHSEGNRMWFIYVILDITMVRESNSSFWNIGFSHSQLLLLLPSSPMLLIFKMLWNTRRNWARCYKMSPQFQHNGLFTSDFQMGWEKNHAYSVKSVLWVVILCDD